MSDSLLVNVPGTDTWILDIRRRASGLRVFDGHERVVEIFNNSVGLRAWVVAYRLYGVHPKTGRPYGAGGFRIDPMVNLAMVHDLARAMNIKEMLARHGARILGLSLPQLFGGAKMGSCCYPSDMTNAMLLALGRALNYLGWYYTAEDAGSTPEMMRKIALGAPDHTGGQGNPPGPATAEGLLAAVAAAGVHIKGWNPESPFRGLKVGISGLGSVGMSCAEQLHVAGANIIVADIVENKVRQACQELGAIASTPLTIPSAPTDALLLCALGGSLDISAIQQIVPGTIIGEGENCALGPSPGEMVLAQMAHEKGLYPLCGTFANSAGLLMVSQEMEDTHLDMRERHPIITHNTIECLDTSRRLNKPTLAVTLDWARREMAVAEHETIEMCREWRRRNIPNSVLEALATFPDPPNHVPGTTRQSRGEGELFVPSTFPDF
jgi:leucine dehydrogenase